MGKLTERQIIEGHVDPDTASRWLRSDAVVEVPEDGWSRELVEDRLAAAIRYVQQTGGKVLPNGFKTAWPRYGHDWGDLLAQAGADEDRRGGRLQLTSQQVTRAEAALEWPMRYVSNMERRKALMIWMMAKAIRRPWQKLAEQAGLNKDTAKDRKGKAIYDIVAGLTRDGTPPEGSGRL